MLFVYMKITSKSTKNMSEANEIELKDSETSVCMKKPKRILHFSDGVLEEYSESETDEQPTVTDSVVSTVSPSIRKQMEW